MGLLDYFKNTVERESFSDNLIYTPVNASSQILTEQLKGQVQIKKIQFPSDLGEEHPFDYEKIDKLVKRFGILGAIIDKHVDFIFSGGINTASEDERAKEIIDDFMIDTEFDSKARIWVRQALMKGFSPMELGTDDADGVEELNLLNANHVYVKREETGSVKGFNQYLKPLNQFKANSKELEEFDPFEIADLNLNVYDDNYYGFGIIQNLMLLINNSIGSNKELHTLMRRKANSPIVATMGNREGKNGKGDYPSKGEMQELGQRFEWLTNKHEWVITDYTKLSTLDFGNIGDKFQFVIENDSEMLFMASQTPSVLMGKANVPEGLAEVQMRAWELRIQSLREEIEKIIEEKIFKRVLISQGLDVHVEIVWGLPSQKEKNEKMDRLTELLKNPFLGENMRVQLEMQVAELLDIPEEEVELASEERQREEEDEKLPKVPSQRKNTPSKNPPKNGIASDEHIHNNESISIDMRISEWIGFNYDEFTQQILKATRKDSFKELRGTTKNELTAGLLPSRDIEKLRIELENSFENNLTIRELEDNINKKIHFSDRLRLKDGQFVLKKNKSRAIGMAAKFRALAIARTETVRLSNLGAIENYKNNNIDKIRWIAAMSDRTCPECEGLNGIIFPINTAPAPPLHTLCRCTTAPVIE